MVMTNQYLESGRGRAAAKQVAGAFQQARQYAISNAATYSVTLTGTTVAVACTAGCPPNAPSEAAAPIVYDATTNVPAPAITFNSLGASNAGTVTITYPNSDPWRVQVTAAGRIRTCSPTCS
jgi:Tfp pilus assembly protein FimT